MGPKGVGYYLDAPDTNRRLGERGPSSYAAPSSRQAEAEYEQRLQNGGRVVRGRGPGGRGPGGRGRYMPKSGGCSGGLE